MMEHIFRSAWGLWLVNSSTIDYSIAVIIMRMTMTIMLYERIYIIIEKSHPEVHREIIVQLIYLN